MTHQPPREETADLRYLDADHVEHPNGTLAGLAVCTEQNEKLGALDGVLIEPSTRRVRYFVVEGGSARNRYVLPADTPVVLDLQDRKLRVRLHAYDLQRLGDPVRPFSDDDVFAAIFRKPAA